MGTDLGQLTFLYVLLFIYFVLLFAIYLGTNIDLE